MPGEFVCVGYKVRIMSLDLGALVSGTYDVP